MDYTPCMEPLSSQAPGAQKPFLFRESTTLGCIAYGAGATCLLLGIGTTGAIWVDRGPWTTGKTVAFAVGVLFLLLGVALPVGAHLGLRASRAKQLRRRQHPASPWLWREDWATGVISSSSTTSAIALGAFALAWNAGIWGALALMWRKSPSMSLGLFCLGAMGVLGLLLLFGAIVSLRRSMKQGASFLRISRMPVTIGGELVATIDVRALPAAAAPARIGLRCEETRTTPGSGRSGGSTTTREVWSTELTVPAAALGRDGGRTSIPVRIAIPHGLLETGTKTPEGRTSIRIDWVLRVAVAIEGLDHLDEFRVPVFDVTLPPDARVDL